MEVDEGAEVRPEDMEDIEDMESDDGARLVASSALGSADRMETDAGANGDEEQDPLEAAGNGGKGDIASAAASVFDEQLLKVYYARLFPHEIMFRWLSYGNDPDKVVEQPQIDKDFFLRREFSFTIANDVYIRYLCFRDEKEMRKMIDAKNPQKIDIGPLYSAPPKNHNMIKSEAFKPLERELVFDIDLTDYDEVRLGCTPDMMWERGSWLYMSLAIKLIDKALRDDFGFEHIVWIFSGRRGVHCWVCDTSARHLEDKERKAVVDYLTLIIGNEQAAQRTSLTYPLHPSVERSLEHLEKVFEKMVLDEEGQDILSEKNKWEKVLKLIPDEGIRERLDRTWSNAEKTSKFRWKQLKATVEDEIKTMSEQRKKNMRTLLALRKTIPTILIVFCYPRLDVNVSTHRNHLLKSPFVIHPKTGKVCVPILDVEEADEFDPDGVPTLLTLIDEINKAGQDDKPESEDINKQTSLQPYLDAFERKFLKPLYSDIKKTWRESAEADAPFTNDW